MTTDLITIRKPTTKDEALWLAKLAHLVISDVNQTLDNALESDGKEVSIPRLNRSAHAMGPRTLHALYNHHLGALEVEPEATDAAIALARDAEKRGFEAGLKAAAQFLAGTASDYTEIYERGRQFQHQTPNQRQHNAILKEKADLLNGQARHVRDIHFR